MRCFDLFHGKEAGDGFGWDGACAVFEYGGDFRKNAEAAKRDGRTVGALVFGDVSENAKKALDAGADLVFVDGRNEEAARTASESWDVDLIVNPELNGEKDLVHQRSSGLDHVMASYMAERKIGYVINFSNLLQVTGGRRVQLFGRIMQNIMLSRRYGVKVVLATGARTRWDVRNPHDMTALSFFLGLTESEGNHAVSENPEHFLKKAAGRNDPNIVTSGVEVKSWGRQERKPKRKHGWY